MNKKYIWTFWTDPYGYKIDLRDLIYLCLSVELVKKSSSNLYIYTDIRGAKEIEKLNILCNISVLDFNIKESIAPKICEAKFKVMSQQDSEFCMIDSDVFLFDPGSEIFKDVSSEIGDAKLVVQSTDTLNKWGAMYKNACDFFIESKVELPIEIKECINENDYRGYNCGYINALDIDLIKEWCEKGSKLIENINISDITHNVVAQEMLIYSICKYNNHKVLKLISDDISSKINTSNFCEVYDPIDVGGYMHLINAKKRICLNCMDSNLRKILKDLMVLNPDFCEKIFNINPFLRID